VLRDPLLRAFNYHMQVHKAQRTESRQPCCAEDDRASVTYSPAACCGGKYFWFSRAAQHDSVPFGREGAGLSEAPTVPESAAGVPAQRSQHSDTMARQSIEREPAR
jgi:hypothetical protein